MPGWPPLSSTCMPVLPHEASMLAKEPSYPSSPARAQVPACACTYQTVDPGVCSLDAQELDFTPPGKSIIPHLSWANYPPFQCETSPTTLADIIRSPRALQARRRPLDSRVSSTASLSPSSQTGFLLPLFPIQKMVVRPSLHVALVAMSPALLLGLASGSRLDHRMPTDKAHLAAMPVPKFEARAYDPGSCNLQMQSNPWGSCGDFINRYRLGMSDFYDMNPAVETDCYRFVPGSTYCISACKLHLFVLAKKKKKERV